MSVKAASLSRWLQQLLRPRGCVGPWNVQFLSVRLLLRMSWSCSCNLYYVCRFIFLR
jgi:hypothetical protein